MMDPEVRPVRLRDGSTVDMRAIRPTDAPALQRLLGRLSDTSNYFRFFRHQRSLSDEQAHRLSEVDGANRFALVAVTPEQPDEVIAVARYVRVEESSRAEFAIAVEDAWQGRGLGRVLMLALADAARARGITHLEGLVLPENTRMIRFLRSLDLPLRQRWDWEQRLHRIEIDLRDDSPRADD